MPNSQRLVHPFLSCAGLLLATFFPLSASAHPLPPATVHFQVRRTYSLPEHLLRARLRIEATGKSPSALSFRVNHEAAWARSILKQASGCRWHTAGYTTQPLSLQKPLWRVQETLVVTDMHPGAVLPLIGTLQSRLHLVSLRYAVPASLRDHIVQTAVSTVLRAFRAEAARSCTALGFSTYRIDSVSVSGTSLLPPNYPHPFPLVMAARTMPGPVVSRPGSDRLQEVATGSVFCGVGQTNSR